MTWQSLAVNLRPVGDRHIAYGPPLRWNLQRPLLAHLIYREGDHIASAMLVNFCRDVFTRQLEPVDPERSSLRLDANQKLLHLGQN